MLDKEYPTLSNVTIVTIPVWVARRSIQSIEKRLNIVAEFILPVIVVPQERIVLEHNAEKWEPVHFVVVVWWTFVLLGLGILSSRQEWNTASKCVLLITSAVLNKYKWNTVMHSIHWGFILKLWYHSINKELLRCPHTEQMIEDSGSHSDMARTCRWAASYMYHIFPARSRSRP